jgi:hypothetical protein
VESQGTVTVDINERRRMGRHAKPRSQKMSTFNISDITPAGAYGNAVTAAQDSDRRNADRHFESGEGQNFTEFLTTLARRIAAAITENCRTAAQLTSRPV